MGQLPGRIAWATRVVPKPDFEPAKPRLEGCQHVDTAARVVLAVERIVVFEHEYGDFRRLEGCFLQKYIDAGRRQRDGSAAHAVTASSASRRPFGGARAICAAILLNAELPGASSRRGCRARIVNRRTGGAGERIAGIARKNRDVVTLVRIEVDLRSEER